MTDPNARAEAIALYDRFTHEGMDRRLFMAEMTRIAGGVAAANALILAISADPAAAAITDAADKRLTTGHTEWQAANGRTMRGYSAKPKKGKAKRAAILVIHENRGLNAHTEDVTRRVALAGYDAVAPDFLSISGGTPKDENAAREAIGKLDLAAATADGVATLANLRSRAGGNGKVGAIGFCWGGAMVNRLAVAAGKGLNAGVPYYGPAPAPSEAAKVEAAMLIQLAGLDQRVNQTGIPWGDALKAAGKIVTVSLHPGVNHAFNNDTSAERYNKAAADKAWAESMAFFKKHLA